MVIAVAVPQALQGHDDENYPMSLLSNPTVLKARYAALGKMKPGIRRYNMFWSSFELAPSITTPNATHCPTGSLLTPASEEQRAALGYHRFHCYANGQMEAFDTIFAMDAAIGAQNGAILHGHCAFRFPPPHALSLEHDAA